MIVWISGPFGAGKSSTVAAVRRLLPATSEFDPEVIGDQLSQLFPGVEDYQDLTLWRSLVTHFLAEVVRHGASGVLVPMTLLREDYATAIFTGLRRRRVPLCHAVLDVSSDELRRRIYAADPELATPHRLARRKWRLDHVGPYEAAREWLCASADLVVDTTSRSVRECAAELIRRTPLAELTPDPTISVEQRPIEVGRALDPSQPK
ncbi:AAA family ATPase [Nocardia sp. Marseille-Q1738]